MINSNFGNRKYFIFNINTSEISGAVVFFNNKLKKPVIEYSSKKKILIEESDSLKNFRKSTAFSLKKVCDDIFKYMKISGDVFNVEEAFVFMSSPWVRKEVETLVEEKVKPFIVTEKFLEDFLHHNYNKKNNEKLLHSEIISIKANGYDIILNNIINKDISKLEVSSMSSYIDVKDRDFINFFIKENFSFIKITNISFLPVLFSQIRKVYDIQEDFAFMDFTGEIMEFGIYQDNNIRNIISIETGKNKIIRSLILNNLAKSIHDGEYIFSLYLRDELEKDKKKEIKKIVDIHVQQIKENIYQELEKYNNFEIPKKVFIVSSGEINQLVEDMDIFEENYFISKTFLKKFVETDDDKNFDNFLALETEYIFK